MCDDIGRDPAKTPLTFFRKASGSVAGPFDDIVKPPHVQLLDYELEIGLLIGRELPVGTEVTEANLAEFVHGLLVTNDVSARDVQLTKAQFYESKSYPTFTPVGPALVLVDADELKRFGDLRLQLRVNGEVRQNMVVEGDMLYPPVQALQAGEVPEVTSGDIVLTGTPVGTALTARGSRRSGACPTHQMDLMTFLAGQAKNPNYLRHGDVVEATVATDDGAIDLGTQRTRWYTHERTIVAGLRTGDDRRCRPDRHHRSHDAWPVRLRVWCWTAGTSTRCRARCTDDEIYRILARLGVGDEFAAHRRAALGLRLHRHRHAGAGGVGALRAQPNGYPQMNMFDQPELEAMLRTNLKRYPHVVLRGDAEVTSVTQNGAGRVHVSFLDRVRGGEHPSRRGTTGLRRRQQRGAGVDRRTCTACRSNRTGWSSM